MVGRSYGPEHTKNILKQKKVLESLYHQVEEQKQIAYAMVQYSGVEAHAFLVFNIKRNLVEGDYHYEVSVQDSNYQSFYYQVNGEVVRLAKPYSNYVWNGRYWMNDHNYRFGYNKPEDFYLYLQKSKDLKKILKVKSAFCSQKELPTGCP